MRISAPEIMQQGNNVRYSSNVSTEKYEQHIWFELDNHFRNLISERTDAALVALLMPAMFSGENIHVSGPISERLFYALSGPLQSLLLNVIRGLKPIQIEASDLVVSTDRATGVATAFSGGIDSFCVLADHFYKRNVPESFRITHLLYNNVGAHGYGGEGLFRDSCARLMPAAKKIGLPFIGVNSNLSEFYPVIPRCFQKTHVLRNVAVAMLLQQGIGRMLYASGFSYRNIAVKRSDDLCVVDPILLPLLSTETTDLISSGSEYTRPEKTEKVASLLLSHEYLDVCANDKVNGNCSACRKCLRTLLTLEIANTLSCYSNVFDLNIYKKRRQRFIAKTLCADDVLSNEIRHFMKEKSFRIPWGAKVYAWTNIPKLFDWLKGIAMSLGKPIYHRLRLFDQMLKGRK